MKKMTEQKKTQIRDAITVVIGVLITFTCLWFTASMLKRPNTEDIRSTKVTKITKETKVETKEEIV